jgi:hypothetical protein
MSANITIKDVIRFLSENELSSEDHNALVQALNARVKAKRNAIKAQFSVGQLVTFFSVRSGCHETGKITKINRKNIDLTAVNGVRWRVSPQLLKPAAG